MKESTMKGKITAISLAVLVTTSSLYAFGGPRGLKDCGSTTTNSFHTVRTLGGADFSIQALMSTILNMDLSSSQWREVRKVMFDLKDQRFDSFEDTKLSALIDKDGNFDRTSFIKAHLDFSKEMIESQAITMEHIFGILSAEQKALLISKLGR